MFVRFVIVLMIECVVIWRWVGEGFDIGICYMLVLFVVVDVYGVVGIVIE